MKYVVLLTILMVLAVACSETKVVSIDQQTTAQEPAKTETATQQPSQPTTPVVNQNETKAAVEQNTQAYAGATPVSCDDTDGNDVSTSGKTVVVYSDGAKQTFVDECPGQSNVQVEYICVGNQQKTKLTICDELCVAGLCI